MKILAGLFVVTLISAGCGNGTPKIVSASDMRLVGSWKLITGTIIKNGDTTVTDYTNDKSFIKIINATHFSFLLHDLKKGSDSATAAFVAGGGRYELHDSLYTEHLEYCSNRPAEGHDFTFSVSIKNDTLVQQGVEEVKETGVNLYNIEKYARIIP
jgi:hypothetical protein